MSRPGCATGLAHMSPPVPGAVRLDWVPYRGQPYHPCARTCHVCGPYETFGWGLSEDWVLLRTEWEHGTSQIAVAESRTQALAWWADLLAGRAV